MIADRERKCDIVIRKNKFYIRPGNTCMETLTLLCGKMEEGNFLLHSQKMSFSVMQLLRGVFLLVSSTYVGEEVPMSSRE